MTHNEKEKSIHRGQPRNEIDVKSSQEYWNNCYKYILYIFKKLNLVWMLRFRKQKEPKLNL